MLSKEQSARVDALTKERDDLIEKLTNLNSFVYSGKVASLSDKARFLLLEQRATMEYYVKLLNKRIAQFITECVG